MCCMVCSSPEKTKSRVTFFFPTPLTNWADVGLKDPHWTDKANSMCRMSDQHWKGTILQSDLCSVENLSQFIFVFLMQRSVLYGDTHNHHKVGRGWKKNVGGSRGDTWWQSKGGLQTVKEWQYLLSVMREIKSIISPAHFPLPPSLLHISTWFCYTGESLLANHSQKYLVVICNDQKAYFIVILFSPSGLEISLCKKLHNDKVFFFISVSSESVLTLFTMEEPI